MKKENPESYPILHEGYVKNFEEKVKNIGRPSIFIGSSAESKKIVEIVKTHFPKEEFEVDAWYDGVFGVTKSEDKMNGLSNMEWLTNFTDIYDYAIFLFLPEDLLTSKLRRDEKGELKSAYVTRHNVVFEFGMFLGKVGAKRCFILMEDENTDSFVEEFFTDLKENLNHDQVDFNTSFKIEIHKFKGNYNASLEDESIHPVDDLSLRNAVEDIKTVIKQNYDMVDLGFLPGTSLAIGYFKNFIRVISRSIFAIQRGDKIYEDSIDQWRKDGMEEEFESYLRDIDEFEIRVVIPDSLEGAEQKNFTGDFNVKDYYNRSFPGINRPMPAICDKNTLGPGSKKLIIYDIPTTMNSSINAIDMLNPRSDIRELLKVKEIRNFKKALEQSLLEASELDETRGIINHVKIITLEEFGKIEKSLRATS